LPFIGKEFRFGILNRIFEISSGYGFYALPGKHLSFSRSGFSSDYLPSFPSHCLPAKLKKRNPTFSISVESVRQKLKENQNILLVDIRKKDEFEKFSIPGSINIPLFAVKTAPPFSFYSFFSY
jgi:hypothetical protein